MDPIFNSNFVPQFDVNQFADVTASPGDLGSLAQSIIGMGNQSQALINALATGQIPDNLFEGIEGMGIKPPKPPSMQSFMAYSNMQAAQQQEESALGDRIKGNAESLVDSFYQSHHLEFDGNGNPHVAATPNTVTASQVDTSGAAQRVVSAQADLTSATTSAQSARSRANTLAATAATDPDGVVPNSNPPQTNAQAATAAAAAADAADAAVQEAQAALDAAQAASTSAQQQAQLEQNSADIQNLTNQLNAGENFDQRQQRQAWEAQQEEATRASFEPQRQALQQRQQEMLAQVQATGRQDPDLMEQLQNEESDLNTQIEKAVLVSKLPPGAAQAPPNSDLGRLYAQITGDFDHFDQVRDQNRAELENSEAGQEIRRFLAESRAFTASLPTREQAFDPNQMRLFAQRMGLTVEAPQIDLGAPTPQTNVNFLGDLGIEPPA